MKKCAGFAAGLLALALGGCAVGPDYHTPASNVPTAYGGMEIALTTRPSSPPAMTKVDLSQWWLALNDPRLDAMVERAISANYDIRIAAARLQEARELENAVAGGLAPVGNIDAAAARGSGTNSTKGRIGAPLNAASNTGGYTEITDIVGFDAGWEVDLFGRLQRTLEAARASTQAVAELRHEVLVTVIAEVVRAYIDDLSLQQRLAITADSIKLERRSVQLEQEMVQNGMANDLDEVLAQRQLSAELSTVAPLEAQLAASRRELATLLGEYASDADKAGSPSIVLPAPPPLALGLPVDLLKQRPDIRNAERLVAESNAQIGVATANLFPRLVLTGGAGFQNQGLGIGPGKINAIWSIGPSFSWPVLDFGVLDAYVQYENEKTREMLLNYRQTVLNAVQEVEDGVSNYLAEQDSLQQLDDAVNSSQRAVKLASARYDRGITDFLNVLDAQRQLYELQDQRAVANAQVLTQFVVVCKALGGGWEAAPEPAAPPKPRPVIVAAIDQIIHPATQPSEQP